MNWIRIAVGVQDDPKLADFAERLKVRLPHAVGYLVCTLVQFPDHAIDGDISKIRPSALERWAGWTGKAGEYDAAFRAVFCTNDIVSSWMKHNGAPIRKALRNADDKRTERERRRAVSTDKGPDGSPDGGSNETRRDETGSSTAVQQLSDSSAVLQQTRDGTAGILPMKTLADRALARVTGGAA